MIVESWIVKEFKYSEDFVQFHWYNIEIELKFDISTIGPDFLIKNSY